MFLKYIDINKFFLKVFNWILRVLFGLVWFEFGYFNVDYNL